MGAARSKSRSRPKDPVSIRLRSAFALRAGMELLVLVMVCLSPWALGAAEPFFEFLLLAGISLLILLWIASILVERQLGWRAKDALTVCLVGLFCWGAWQLQPIPRPILGLLSPTTSKLFDRFVSSNTEVLPNGEAFTQPPLAAGSSLSLYPGATRHELVRLLSYLAVFFIVRNQIASVASFRRLSYALVINGTLLAVFAIIHALSSQSHTVYWTIMTAGQPFGPFICRNHFPFYVNVCIGTGIGLLVSLSRGDTDKDPNRDDAAILITPGRLWLSFALAIMVASIALSLSRGGMLALASGAALLWVFRPARSRRLARLRAVMLIACAGLALIFWLSHDRVEAQLATLATGKAIEQDRWPLWLDAWNLAIEFPLCGTGYGTFPYVEPLHRDHTGPMFIHEHAHNEYLEALVEGGVVRLALTVAILTFVFRAGARVLKTEPPRTIRGLASGALFGIATLAVHSAGDFGIHLPAVALLTAVVSAQLVSLGERGGTSTEERRFKEEVPADGRFSQRHVALALAAFFGVGLAAVFCSEGWRISRAHQFSMAARALVATRDPDDQELGVAYLTQATKLLPESVRLETDLAQANLSRFQAGNNRLQSGRQLAESLQLVAGAYPPGLGGGIPLGWAFTGPSAGAAAWDAAAGAEQKALVDRYMAPALRHSLYARAVCPLAAKPYLLLAANAPYLERGSSPLAYLECAKQLVTNDPQLWFLFGCHEMIHNRLDDACASWRRSLDLSEAYLNPILDMAQRGLDTQAILQKILPADPQILLTAAEHAYPAPAATTQRLPYLTRAMLLLREQPGPRTADDLHLRAKIQLSMGQSLEAVNSYRRALERDPGQMEWRVELAKVLAERGEVSAAKDELVLVLRTDPDHTEARRLFDSLGGK